MCGLAGLFGHGWEPRHLEAMMHRQHHRGPDAAGTYVSPSGLAGFGHTRLSIIDRSRSGLQPMRSADGRLHLVLNGEIYNYRELRAELGDYPFQSQTDTEVVLAAYERWGEACLDRFIGMFALAIWDEREQRLFAARDRFGVKPLYYARTVHGALALASEIKALWAAGVRALPDAPIWATYLTTGLHDHTARTFWRDIVAVPPGHTLCWTPDRMTVRCWYDVAARVGDAEDPRSDAAVEAEYTALLTESVRLRFRADVPVGVAVSGGLDSSVLLGAVRATQGAGTDVAAFTFVTGVPAYDELPWVQQALVRTGHPLVSCALRAEQVPELAASVQAAQDEPFGGLPTLAYARVFEEARARGVIVLLDGQGMDEQWAGYDYYGAVLNGRTPGIVQGTHESPVRPECLVADFRALAEPLSVSAPFADQLRNVQYRDLRHTKIPRALRFSDRVSMRASVELREPFLDHRLVELALCQPVDRKIRHGVHKHTLRQIAKTLIPDGIVTAPKRPVQTPQREWLRGPLRDWGSARIAVALEALGGSWLDTAAVRREWEAFGEGRGDNSFFVWQWITLGLLTEQAGMPAARYARA